MHQHDQPTQTPGRPMSRVLRSKAEAKATYNRLSRWYDLVEGRFERAYIDAGLARLGVRAGESVLEIGFGTGHAIVALAQAVGDTGRVYGVDISEGMLAVTQAHVNAAGLAQRVELHCGDAARLPFDADRFDAVFMSFVLELFDTPEIPLVLGECARVLRPGGRLGLVASVKREKDTAMVRLYEWAHRTFPTLVDCRPIELRAPVEAAGFHVTELTSMMMWGLPVDILIATK